MNHVNADATALQPAEPEPEAPPAPPPPLPFVPISTNQRIEALDVVRGFALLGIFLMNIESYNRWFSDIFARGIPLEATGLDWAATFFVNYFVQGKFWTIFSTLFGMGFAVMLVRAEQAGQPFVQVYLRRILALAVFGACHYIFLWEGDILFSYAVGALMLLMVLYAKARVFLASIAVCVGLGFLAEPFFAVAGGLAAAGLNAIYLRSEKKLRWRGREVPIYCVILMAVGVILSIAAVVFWVLPDGPTEPRLPLTVIGPLMTATGWLLWKLYEPADKRALRLAVVIYVFAGMMMTGMSLAQHFSPDPLVVLQEAAKKEAADKARAAQTAPIAAAETPAPKPADAAAKPGKAASEAKAVDKKTKAERAEKMKKERDTRKREREEERAKGIRLLSKGSYADQVLERGRQFPEKVAGDFGFGVALTAMFLLGMWFVRSGVMQDTGAHLPLFRRLATGGLALGLGLSMVSAAIAVSHVPGERYDGWGIANGLHMLANLPACVGYISLVVLMLHSRGPLSRISVLAPLGRMALTNYLMQTIICCIYFYGWGLGHWGMGRAGQMVFVAVVFVAQIAFSHWWLARFRYGPMEWLWRGFTYRQVPPLRVAPQGTPTPAPAV